MPKKRDTIIYPVFMQASVYARDNKFWDTLFQDLSYGICPYGTYFDSDTLLCCRFKNKEFNFNFLNRTPEEIYNDLHKLLCERLNILSKQEQYERCLRFKKFLCQKKGIEWNEIKKKNIKDILIENYVIAMTKTHNLSKLQMKKLLCSIMLGFQFKLITNKDIVYDSANHCITNIEGIKFEENKVRFTNTGVISPDTNILTTHTKSSKIVVREYWDKYLSGFE